MQGLKIQCPNCKRIMFETTDKFNPDVTPNGSFVKSLAPYQIDWLTMSTTLCSEMTCPECLAQLAPSGRLTVIQPTPVTPMEVGIPGEEEKTLDEQIEGVDRETEAGMKALREAKTISGGGKIKVPMEPTFVCDICGKVLKNKFGLIGHQRSHRPKEAKP